MIALPPGVRVYLACGITDMRNYAEFRSCEFAAIISRLPRLIRSSHSA